MAPLFLPEIEDYAYKDPNLYEILYRIQAAFNTIPVASGAATPSSASAVGGSSAPISAADPASTTPATQSPGDTSSAALNTPTPISGGQGSIFIGTDPTGGGAQISINTNGKPDGWMPIMKILKPKNTGLGQVSPKFIPPGTVILQSAQFDNQGRTINSFFSNPLDATGRATSQPLTQVGVTTVIAVASTTWQFGGFSVNYNSGSVDPGALGTYFVFADDPQFNGGNLVFQASLNSTDALNVPGRLFFGKITTAGGGGGTGGGSGTGGNPNLYS